jgi:hypothetical protein
MTGQAPNQSSSSLLGTGLGLGATYLLYKKYGQNIKNFLRGKNKTPTGELEQFKNEGKLTDGRGTGDIIDIKTTEVSPTSKPSTASKFAKELKSNLKNTKGKIGIGSLGGAAIAAGVEGYNAYTDIQEQSAKIDAQQKLGKISAEAANVKKREIVGGTVGKTAVRTAGGLAGAEAGALGGAAFGAAVGSVVPIVGNVAGGIVGGLVGGGLGYFAGQKVTDATGITENAGEIGKMLNSGKSGVSAEESKKIEAHLKEMRAASDVRAQKLGFKDQQDQVNAIKSGLVKPGEHKPEENKQVETPKESSVKEKIGTTQNNNDTILKSIADNTNKTNASIQGLTAGIYKLAEAIAKSQGGKVSPTAFNFNPIMPQAEQQGPSAAEYTASYTSPGQHIRQKAFNTFNG